MCFLNSFFHLPRLERFPLYRIVFYSILSRSRGFRHGDVLEFIWPLSNCWSFRSSPGPCCPHQCFGHPCGSLCEFTHRAFRSSPLNFWVWNHLGRVKIHMTFDTHFMIFA